MKLEATAMRWKFSNPGFAPLSAHEAPHNAPTPFKGSPRSSMGAAFRVASRLFRGQAWTATLVGNAENQLTARRAKDDANGAPRGAALNGYPKTFSCSEIEPSAVGAHKRVFFEVHEDRDAASLGERLNASHRLANRLRPA